MVRPAGLCQRKIPMTQLGNEPATFRFVVQCLNQLCHRVSPCEKSIELSNDDDDDDDNNNNNTKTLV